MQELIQALFENNSEKVKAICMLQKKSTSINDAATLVSQPGKFIIGIDATLLGCGSSKILLNGVSS